MIVVGIAKDGRVYHVTKIDYSKLAPVVDFKPRMTLNKVIEIIDKDCSIYFHSSSKSGLDIILGSLKCDVSVIWCDDVDIAVVKDEVSNLSSDIDENRMVVISDASKKLLSKVINSESNFLIDLVSKSLKLFNNESLQEISIYLAYSNKPSQFTSPVMVSVDPVTGNVNGSEAEYDPWYRHLNADEFRRIF